ncbi:MAG TPA: peptide-N-glycosidase F-related protein, partial [Saprospiraceae bacterium]|nr:peptide-N-glycosidase F-related protein [Saprospiraceae bacterium]
VALELFYDSDDPELRTNLSYVWVPDTTFFYSEGLTSINQLPNVPEVLDLEFRPYFSDPFEVIERFELGRYITPYGIGIDLGEGWTWIFDVTDYLPVLKGNKRLTAGNWQEWLDLKFLFIEGTPTREVKRIQNVHSGRYEYRSSDAANENLENKKMGFLEDSEMAKLKVRNSGHGFGGNLNCAEFCPRNNRIMVDGQMAYSQYFWRDDCGLNPLKGQGGTWVYNRSNWCPGDLVNADEYELTDLVDFNDSVRIDYHLQDGYTWNGQGSVPYYRIENQLVEYGPLNHNLDLRIEEIIAPNVEEIYGNDNPLCGKPIVRVRNTGAQDIASISFNYGIEGGLQRTHELTDLSLGFDQVAEYELPLLTSGTWPESQNQRFFVEVAGVNGAADENSANNSIVSKYTPPRQLNPDYDGFIISVRTNNNGNETSYRLRDGEGNILLDRSNLSSNTVYNDTFYVEDGCYEFEILDAGNDGLQWWANSAQGSGYATVRGLFQGFGLAFIGLDPDFGSAYKVQFTVGEVVSNEEDVQEEWGFDIAPNPVSDFLGIQMKGFHPGEVQIQVRDNLGRVIYQKQTAFDGMMVLNQLNLPNGIYWLSLQQDDHGGTKKFVVAR